MATWHSPQETGITNSQLDKIWRELSVDLADHPSFSEIVGIEPSEVAQHAMFAVTHFIKLRGEDPTNPTSLIQLYTLGFVVGTRYGMTRKAIPHPMKEGSTNDDKDG